MDSLSDSYSVKSNFRCGFLPGDDFRKTLFALARSAEKAERYKDVCKFMTDLASKIDNDLNPDERELLCVGYTRAIHAQRTASKALTEQIAEAVETDEEIKTNYTTLLTDYKAQVDREISASCDTALELFEGKLLDRDKSTAITARIVYLKTIGDLYRYKAECNATVNGQKAAEYYKQALKLAEVNHLDSTSPFLLDIVLNYSVCLKEVMGEDEQAIQLAKTAFDHAIGKLDDLDESTYKDTTLILQLIRDNHTLWNKR